MLFGHEACRKGWRLAIATHFDIVVLVAAHRNFGKRRVGNFSQRGIQRFDSRLFLRFQFTHAGLELSDFRFQRIGTRSIFGGHRLTDFLRGAIAALLGGLQSGDGHFAGIIQTDEFVGERLEPTAGTALIEKGRILADPLDVVHKFALGEIVASGMAPKGQGCKRAQPATGDKARG